MDDFQLKMANFEGPLDLLLSLIEKRKMHISDISLAKVSDDYVAYLNQHSGTNMRDMANFILVAATLMLIKSASLLPTLALTEEEQESISDLERRLKMYQMFKELSAHIKERFGQTNIYFKEPSKNIEPVFTPTPEISTVSLLTSVKGVINSFPKLEKIPQLAIKKIISLEEVIEDLARRIQSSIKMKFSEFATKDKTDRVSIIVSFLGMLELVKQGIIEVKQETLFNDIDMETRKVGVPRIE